MPSKSEPCGLSQLIAMHYGTVPSSPRPAACATPSRPITTKMREGRGFTFQSYNADDFLGAIDRAIGLYFGNRDKWNRLAQNDMRCDVSWRLPAQEYQQLYHESAQNKGSSD